MPHTRARSLLVASSMAAMFVLGGLLTYFFAAGPSPAVQPVTGLLEAGGIEVTDYRDRTVLIVPEGMALIAWRPPGLSDLARYGDRLYRLEAADE